MKIYSHALKIILFAVKRYFSGLCTPFVLSIFKVYSEVLLIGKIQINLVFLLLNRIFAKE